MTKKVKKTLVILTSILLMTNITGCGNTKVIEPYTINSEGWIEQGQWNKMLESVDELINIRYTGYDEEKFNGYADILETQTFNMLKTYLSNNEVSTYYDIEEVYQKEFNSIKQKIEAQGGTLTEDLDVFYNGEPVGTETDESETGKLSDNAEEPTVGTSENKVNLVGEPLETEEKNSTEAASVEKDIDKENIVDTNEEGTVDNIEDNKSLGETEKDTEETEEKEENTEDSEVWRYDIPEEVADPRSEDLYDKYGILVWEGKSQGEIDNMTPEENAEFDKIYNDLLNSYRSNAAEYVEKEQLKESLETEDTGDADLEERSYTFNKDELLSITSKFIQLIDGRHVISWRYIIDHYNHETGRLNYNVLGMDHYLEVDEAVNKMSPYVYIGDETYKFKRDKYELLDNSLVNIEYKSYTDNEALKYDLVISGSLEDGKLKLDSNNIRKFVDLYQ